MKAATTLIAVTCLALGAMAADPVKPTLTQEVAFTSALARGLLSGYEKGMYKLTNYKVNDKCLDATFQKQFVDTFTAWGTTDFSWTNQASMIQGLMLQVTNWCDYDEALYVYLSFCYYSDQCLIPYMAQSLMSKIFQVTTVANDVVQLWTEGFPKIVDKPATVENFGDRVGQDVGKLLRYATDYDPTLYPPKAL